jgi:hypothetical protein
MVMKNKNVINQIFLVFFTLLLLPLTLFSQSQGGEGEEPDEETLRLTEYSDLDTTLEIVDCFPLVKVQKVSVLNFQTFSHVYISFFEGFSQDSLVNLILFLQRGEGSPSILPIEWVNGFLRVVVDTSKVYYIFSKDDCGGYSTIGEFSTIPKSAEEIIVISEAVNEAISEWQSMGENADLYDVLGSTEGISPYERYEFLQSFVKNGEPLPDAYAYVLNIPRNAFLSDTLGRAACRCRVMEIRMYSEVFPTASDQLNPTILPVFIAPNQMIIRENERIKFWEAGAFEGPARYQQIWGETKRCRNVTESAVWGDGGSPLSIALGHASIVFRQVCLEGHWLPEECFCEQVITVRYKYDAHLSARSGTKSGDCFNPPGKRALAAVDDIVMVLAARNPNPASASNFTVFFSDASVRGVVSTCNRDFQEKRLLEIFKIGLVAYAYAKGFPIITKIPVIDQTLQAVWQEYQKSNFLVLLERLITNPWVTGSCTQVSTNHGIDILLSFTLKDREAIRFTMTSASELMVSGMTAWEATARVLSGFSLSAALELNDVSEGDVYCCTKPAGIYMMSTSHPIQTIETYRQAVGSHFTFSGLNCCFPVSPVTGQVIITEERGRMFGSGLPGCQTVIRSIPSSGIILSEGIKVYFLGNSFIVEGLDQYKTYIVSVLSIDGKMLYTEAMCVAAILFP